MSADGKQLIAASREGQLYGWNVESGESTFLRRISGDSFYWFGLGFSPDGSPAFTRLLVAENGNRCLLENPRNGRNLHVFGDEKWSPTSVDIVADGKWFMGAQFLTTEGKIAVRIFGGAPFAQHAEVLINPKEVPRNVACSPDATKLVVVHQNFKVSIWSVADGSLLSETDEFPTECQHELPAVLTPDGRSIVVAGYDDGTIRIFDAATGKRTRSFTGCDPGGHLTISRDGQRLAHRGTHRVQLWDMATGKELHHPLDAHQLPPAVTFRPDGKEVATATSHEVRFWNPQTGVQLHHWNLTEPVDRVRSLLYSPDGKQLLIGRTRSLELRDRSTGTIIHRAELPGQPTAAFHPDGKRFIIAGAEDTLEVRDRSSGKILEHLKVESMAQDVAISPDGTQILTAHSSGLRLSRLKDGQLLNSFATEEDTTLEGVAFDASGRFATAVQMPGRVYRVIDLGSGLHRDGPSSAATEPPRRSCLARSSRIMALAESQVNGTSQLQCIDTATGQVRNRRKLPYSIIHSVSFDPSGRYLATANSDTTVLIWDIWREKGEFAVPDQVTEEMVREQWEHLGVEYVEQVDWMIQVMCRRPELTLSLLRQKLNAAEPVAAAQLNQLITDLGAARFAVRQRATRELTRLGESVIDQLRRHRDETQSEDLRVRIERILEEIDQPLLRGHRLRCYRAIEILERLPSPEATELLRTLAAGDPHALLTREARRALKQRE